MPLMIMMIGISQFLTGPGQASAATTAAAAVVIAVTTTSAAVTVITMSKEGGTKTQLIMVGPLILLALIAVVQVP